jgi:hypothetical protein
MALRKEVVVALNGAPATVHRVDNVTLNKLTNATFAVVSCFYSADALKQGLNPLAQVSIQLEGMPANGQDAFDFAEAALAAAAPDDVTVNPFVTQFGADRYAFAGADVLDL